MSSSLLIAILFVLTASINVSAHSHEAPSHYKRDYLHAQRSLEVRCASQLAARRNKRDLQIGSHLGKRDRTIVERATGNSSCILTPETTQGPYHILGEIVRQNMTENIVGVPLELHLDFVDIETCEPVEVFVDSWHASPIGEYSGYVSSTTNSSSTSGMGNGGAGAGSMSGGGGLSGMSMPSNGGGGGQQQASVTSISPTSGADSANGSGLSQQPTDTQTFLRGAWSSDSEGHLTMYSVVPGWYSGRAQHYHIKAYRASDASRADNGTFVVTADAVHTGQLFWGNDTLNAVAETAAYAANSIPWSDRVINEADSWFVYADSNGYDAVLADTWVNASDVSAGIVSYTVIGLNMSFSSPEITTAHAGFNLSDYVSNNMITTGSIASTTGTLAARATDDVSTASNTKVETLQP